MSSPIRAARNGHRRSTWFADRSLRTRVEHIQRRHAAGVDRLAQLGDGPIRASRRRAHPPPGRAGARALTLGASTAGTLNTAPAGCGFSRCAR